jgi:hypothetical protein
VHHRQALLWVEAVEQSVRFGGRVGRVHTHVAPNLPPPGDGSGPHTDRARNQEPKKPD